MVHPDALAVTTHTVPPDARAVTTHTVLLDAQAATHMVLLVALGAVSEQTTLMAPLTALAAPQEEDTVAVVTMTATALVKLEVV